jgi:hypothetical protein
MTPKRENDEPANCAIDHRKFNHHRDTSRSLRHRFLQVRREARSTRSPPKSSQPDWAWNEGFPICISPFMTPTQRCLLKPMTRRCTCKIPCCRSKHPPTAITTSLFAMDYMRPTTMSMSCIWVASHGPLQPILLAAKLAKNFRFRCLAIHWESKPKRSNFLSETMIGATKRSLDANDFSQNHFD